MNFRRIIIISFSLLLLYNPASSYDNSRIDYPAVDWNTLNSIHFEITYPAGHEGLALMTAELAERGYVRVSDYLGHEMTKVITIVTYPSNHHVQRDDIFDAANGVVTVPFHGSYAELQRTLTRTFVFAFQHDICSESALNMITMAACYIPFWFSLGLAEYIAYGYDTGAEMDLFNFYRENRHLGIRDLHDMRCGSPDLCRRRASAFFHFIEKRYGRAIIGEMLRDFGSLRYIDDVIFTGTGKTVEEVDAEWADFLCSRYQIFKKKLRVHYKNIKYHEEVLFTAEHLIPAVSPDGKKVACLAEKALFPELVILDSARKSAKTSDSIIARFPLCGQFGSGYSAGNNITWTGDGKSIVMAVRSNGREYLHFINTHNGRTQHRIPLPFSAVMYPSVSRDGRRIAFTGIAGCAEDIYMYDRGSGTTIRVTDDDFSDRYPVFSLDGRSIIYSSNWNPKGDAARTGYAIFRHDLQTGKRYSLVPGVGNNIQADISSDGTKMLYVSDMSGVYNAYVYDFITGNSRRVTDSLNGIHRPRWLPDGRSFVCVGYRGEKFVLFLKDESGASFPETQIHVRDEVKTLYHTSYIDQSRYIFRTYSGFIRHVWFHLGAEGTFNNSHLCFLQFGMSDYLGTHRLVLSSNYSHESQNRNHDINAEAAYYYRPHRWDLGLSLFRQASPHSASSIESINSWRQQPVFGLISMEHYGGYTSARYSISRFMHISLRAAVARYKKSYPNAEHRADLRATAGNISISVLYDNVIQGAMVPINGFIGRLHAEQCIDFTGGNSFSRVDVDLKGFICIEKHLMIALRGAGGSVIGKNRGHFNYYLGGYDTLRGYDMLIFSGRHMFLVNAELRIAGNGWMNFGMPLAGGLGNVAAVVFIDAGAAWDGRFSIAGGRAGNVGDLKMDFGFGIRCAVYPVLIFKLDFAWPFDKRSIKKNVILFSAGFMY